MARPAGTQTRINQSVNQGEAEWKARWIDERMWE